MKVIVIRTENLTILFVDIAGFTATTSRQSRVQNARLLQTFGSTLLPLIKYYKGRLIKTIGDALLITFRSPTDAMLCSMAFQDAMHAHNLSAAEDEKIHIRVAANLGEVRVTKKDIFGEPVNVASRIEGVAPADEIYLSEAVYMAMNKAEVPSLEVGFRELKGVSQAVRLYNIPRFSTPRLVAENASAEEQGSEVLYPYGGMHYHTRPSHLTNILHFSEDKKLTRVLLPAVAVLIVAAAVGIGYHYINKKTPEQPAAVKTTTSETQEAATASRGSQQPLTESGPTELKSEAVVTTTTEKTANIPKPASEGQVQKPERPIEERAASPAAGKPAKAITENAKAIGPNAGATTSTKTEPVAIKKGVARDNAPAKQAVSEPDSESAEETNAEMTEAEGENVEPDNSKQNVSSSASTKATDAATKDAAGWGLTSAKEAYRASKLSKAEYSKIVRNLKSDYEKKIVKLKQDLRAGKITRSEYDKEVRQAKQDYRGR
jgi:adenylate cyclase